MKTGFVFWSFLLLTCTFSFAQKTGTITYDQLGIEFTIPDGWVGQEGQGVFILGSHTVPGLVLLTTHTSSTLDQLKAEAQKGIMDQNGTNLNMVGEFEDLGDNAVGTALSGTMEWTKVKGYIIGVINPYGTGVTILVASTPEQYGDELKQAAFKVKKSIVFEKPKTGPVVKKWKDQIKGRRLHHISSYYSGGSVSGGYSSEVIIELCNSGSFYYSSNSDMTISGSGISGYDSDKGNGNGNWDVGVNASGQAVLKLNFNNGEVYSYTLSFPDKYLHLNGKKYFRTSLEWCN